MDIADAVTTEYVDVNPGTRLSKLRGRFDEDPTLRAILVQGQGSFEGAVTRKELVASKQSPDAKAQSVVRHLPKVSVTEDVRETARLMVENETKLLPVFEDGSLRGVVTATDLLAMVGSNLGALDVADVYTRDVVSVEPDTTVGEVIHRIRTHTFTRVPVVDERDPAGMISVSDLMDFTTREVDREQGGSHPGFDGHGGQGSRENFRTTGGKGERSGYQARLLDLPARDVMNTPVATVELDVPLDAAFEQMVENEHTSLVVVPDDSEEPAGIVTVTDLLRALTWTDDDHVDVQVFGVDLLDDLSREDIAVRIEDIDGKYERMDVLEANVVFHEHKEKQRGTPLLQATARLFTDEGRFAGSGDGYGARMAFQKAADVLERNVMDDKERKSPAKRKERASEREAERERAAELVEWWVEG